MIDNYTSWVDDETPEVGTMCGVDDAISHLESLQVLNHDETIERIINRLKYIRDKDTGIKPRFRKGLCGHKYDRYTCGHCGVTIRGDVVDNYCQNCGYRIRWDNPRCLTATFTTIPNC